MTFDDTGLLSQVGHFAEADMRGVPNLTALASGRLELLEESKGEYGRVAVQFLFSGITLADESTCRDWRVARAVELREAAALTLHLDPESIQWDALDIKASPRGPTIGTMLVERVVRAAQHAKRGSLPCLKVATDPGQSLVTLWEFAIWCDALAIPCPDQMPRTDPGLLVASVGHADAKAKPTTKSAYVRMGELAQGLVPMSKATIYRMVKVGTFPNSLKASKGIAAWARSDVEAWVQAQAQPKPRKSRRGD